VKFDISGTGGFIFRFFFCEHLLEVLTESDYYPIPMRSSVLKYIYNPCFPNASLFEGT
jgi:hypothetical protein